MNLNKSLKLFIFIISMNGFFAHADTSGPLRPNVSKIEGLCKNGKDYFKMTISHDGYISLDKKVMSLYVYQGPLGTGYIPSNVPYEKARIFVCKETSERWLPDDLHGE
jgi:hypothetical protein